MNDQIKNELAVLVGLPLCYASRPVIRPRLTGDKPHFAVTAHGIER